MIRKANHKDQEIVVTFNYNLAKETEALDLPLDRLVAGVGNVLEDSSKGIYYVYVLDGQVVGQMMVTLEWSDWRNGYFWWIQSVYVHKEYRGQGIFQALYQYVKGLAENDAQVCGLRLYVEGANTAAQKAYEKIGMNKTEYHFYEVEF